MDIAPMTRALPTTAQAERIRELFDEAVNEHPRQTELLRGIERTVIQEPDDNGPGLPEPVEPMIQQLVAGVLTQGLLEKRKMRKILRENEV
jgi:hypothetical protein